MNFEEIDNKLQYAFDTIIDVMRKIETDGGEPIRSFTGIWYMLDECASGIDNAMTDLRVKRKARSTRAKGINYN